jgi:hypothetical protein
MLTQYENMQKQPSGGHFGFPIAAEFHPMAYFIMACS